jgi:hypothetical protein
MTNKKVFFPRTTTHRGGIDAGQCARQFLYASQFLAKDPEVPGSIPGATRFSE